MLLLSNDLLTKQVLSLRTNQAVAVIKDVLINPNNLKVEGFYCQDTRDKSMLILLGQDIRETIRDGYIINDHDVLSNPEDLIRLKEVINIHFSLIGKPVETVSGAKVGKVQDYSTDLDSLSIQKLYVSQPLYKSLNGGNLAIDRTQVNEITPKRIIIYDLMGTVPAQAKASII